MFASCLKALCNTCECHREGRKLKVTDTSKHACIVSDFGSCGFCFRFLSRATRHSCSRVNRETAAETPETWHTNVDLRELTITRHETPFQCGHQPTDLGMSDFHVRSYRGWHLEKLSTRLNFFTLSNFLLFKINLVKNKNINKSTALEFV